MTFSKSTQNSFLWSKHGKFEYNRTKNNQFDDVTKSVIGRNDKDCLIIEQ